MKFGNHPLRGKCSHFGGAQIPKVCKKIKLFFNYHMYIANDFTSLKVIFHIFQMKKQIKSIKFENENIKNHTPCSTFGEVLFSSRTIPD